MTKTEARKYATRARESLREMEQALRRDDLQWAREMAMQASGECGEAERIIEELLDGE